MDQTVQRIEDRKPQVRRTRKDGWTAAAQRIFFDHLCATCNVRFAAQQAGVSATGAHGKRRRDPIFRERWRQALEDGYVRIETLLLARAGGTADAEALARVEEMGDAGDAGALLELTEAMDTPLALSMLANHRKALHGGTRKPGGPALTKADPDELAETILKRLSAFNKQRGGG